MGVKYVETDKLDKINIKRMIDHFGKRPGGYRVDPNYFRAGIGNKAYWWDDYKRKWTKLNFGDEFDFDENGIMVKVSD